MRVKYETKPSEEVQIFLDKIKQTIERKDARLRRYPKRSHFYKDFNLFKNNMKQFYRTIGESQIKINKAPPEEETHSSWQKIWSDSKSHNYQTPWIEYETLKEKTLCEITLIS